MIGIIGAMDSEVNGLKTLLGDYRQEEFSGLVFAVGKINNNPVAVVKCGIGKVNAAFCTAALIFRYNADSIINIGVSGGIGKRVKVLDIIIADGLCQHDFDLSAFGLKRGQLSEELPLFLTPSKKITDKLLDAAKKLGASPVLGKIVSGDQFISDGEKTIRFVQDFGADGVEMESAAVAQVCTKAGVDFAVLRTVSDRADEEAKESFEEIVEKAAAVSIQIINEYIKSI